MTHDAIIAGAGPAGSSLAIHLARQGRAVLLLDRSNFPREKACGEGLMPAGVAALRRLGLEIDGAPFLGVRYHCGHRVVTGRFPGAVEGAGIRRSQLDMQLLSAARAECNVEVQTGSPVSDLLLRDGVVIGVATADCAHYAPLVIGADGANSVLRHKLGWDASRRASRYGVRRHYRVDQPADPWVHVYLGEACETYVTPLRDCEILVATLGDQPGRLPPALEALQPIDEPLGAAPLTVRAHRRFGPGCVLVGDAAGSCDPITGGGISQALLSSELLAKHLDAAFPPTPEAFAAFDRARERMLSSYRSLTTGVLALAARPALLKPSLSLLQHSPALFSRLLAMAGGTA